MLFVDKAEVGVLIVCWWSLGYWEVKTDYVEETFVKVGGSPGCYSGTHDWLIGLDCCLSL